MDINSDSDALLVLRTLAYYDIFKYPLTESDIFANFDHRNGGQDKCRTTLHQLVEEGIIYRIGDYFSLQYNRQHVKDRIVGNQRAEKWEKKARWFSRLIAAFPYVRGIALSGSLSKGVIGDDPDIDYFIITHPNRLWLTRTLLVLFKKIFLLNSYKYFCINYFVDTENLEIEEKNLFTATEVITLIPTYGHEITQRFFEANNWILDYYPNFKRNGSTTMKNKGFQPLKKLAEFIFRGKPGDWIDNRFMEMTVRHWFKKFRHQFPEEEFNLVFKSSKSISKHHPRNFQKVVLNEYKKRVNELNRKFNIQLDEVQAG